MKRLKKVFGVLLGAIVTALKWTGNILAFPFRKVRKANKGDLGILGGTGMAFTIAGVFLLNIKWDPLLGEYGLYASIVIIAIGVIMLIFSLVGFIK